MKQFSLNGNDSLTIDTAKGYISSLICRGAEKVADILPLFRISLLDKNGKRQQFSSFDAACTSEDLVFSGFAKDIKVYVDVKETENGIDFTMRVDNNTEDLIEWADFPLLALPELKENMQSGGQLLLPYNEGVIVSDSGKLSFSEPAYPSMGNYPVFPNMMFSQFMAYCFSGTNGQEGAESSFGLFIGALDPARGPKGIWAERAGNGISPVFRIYCGKDFGEDFLLDYPIRLQVFNGSWEAAAEIYRQWLSCNLPVKAKKTEENSSLPEWYRNSPVVVSYPIRGIHDMDVMDPNKLFPYKNAIPLIDEIHRKTGADILVLLMHWEGTAPWAPPHVWPPYGGEKLFSEFCGELHKRGYAVGVYCSGFGYTIQSNLIESYNKQQEYDHDHLEDAMCAGSDGKIEISNICTFQRSGYDICPASPKGKELLNKAYQPLFESTVDYAQILDQNHGGGQYFCYSAKHGHAPSPGAWMTGNMQELLSDWNQRAPGKLFGCESAAAEPFIGNLLFSDNRYELCYYLGHPVPLYSYLFHEYLRNFMGNQVSCPFPTDTDTLRMRIAYSFTAGDSLTLVITPDGDLMVNWGTRDFDHHPDKEKTLLFIKNLMQFYREEGKKYLCSGKMIMPLPIECDSVRYSDNIDAVPAVMTSAWEAADHARIQIFVNYTDAEQTYVIGSEKNTIPPLSVQARMLA